VADTGIGIETEHQSIIFSLFGNYQARNLLKEQCSAGLGLTISYKLIKGLNFGRGI
jgi:signal transduction histidine kinase